MGIFAGISEPSTGSNWDGKGISLLAENTFIWSHQCNGTRMTQKSSQDVHSKEDVLTLLQKICNIAYFLGTHFRVDKPEQINPVRAD